MKNISHYYADLNAEKYAASCELNRLTMTHLLTQLLLMKIEPQTIVNLGCGIGEGLIELQNRFPAAKIVAADSAKQLLHYAKSQTENQIEFIAMDRDILPLEKNSVDLIITNLFLSRAEDCDKLLREVKRILKPDGLFLFSCFGLDTLEELQTKALILPRLVDMHVIGDMLTSLRFAEPVLDVERYLFKFSAAQKCWDELLATGIVSAQNDEPLTEITYEVIYGHAFAPASQQTEDPDGTIRIPIETLIKPNKNSH